MTTPILAAVANIPDLLGTAPADLIGADTYDSTPEEARERADRLCAGIVGYAQMRQDIADAFACRDWIALGYDNWAAYIDGEFGELLTQLVRGERQQAVADLRGQGMSTRQIAGAMGVDPKTVRNDLAQVGTNSPPAEKVTGADGKSYAASRPRPAVPGPSDAAVSPPVGPATTEAPPASTAAHDPRADGGGPGGFAAPRAGANVEPAAVPGLAQQIWDLLDAHGNRPYGMTIGEIWVKLPDVPSVDIAPALAELAAERRAMVMSHADGKASIEHRARWLNVRPSAAETATPEPDHGAVVAAALDKFVPDTGKSERDWQKDLYVRVKPVHDFLLWLKAEDVAAFADEQDLTTLRHLATGFTDAHRRAVDAANSNVTPLRRVQ